ncbi:uncharacterized protein ACNS7B_012991 [Menidia menidia]
MESLYLILPTRRYRSNSSYQSAVPPSPSTAEREGADPVDLSNVPGEYHDLRQSSPTFAEDPEYSFLPVPSCAPCPPSASFQPLDPPPRPSPPVPCYYWLLPIKP